MKLFLDTMMWLHFRPIGDTKLAELAGATDPVEIVVPIVVINELNGHKDNRREGKLSARARAALKLCEQAQDSGGLGLNNGCVLTIYHEPPGTDFGALGLDESTKDHKLIAAILSYRAQHPGERIVFLSDDTGARIVAKRLGIETKSLPDDHRLPAEQDPVEKENRELREQVRLLRDAIPKLTCRFDLGEARGSHLEVRIRDAGFFSERDAGNIIESLRQEFPRRNPPPPTQAREPESLMERILHHGLGMDRISEEEYARYNQEVDVFFQEYPDYLRRLHEHKRLRGVSVEIRLAVENAGNIPAEDVDLRLHFPDGFTLGEEGAEEPAEPHRPSAPRKWSETLVHPSDYLHELAMPQSYLSPQVMRAVSRDQFRITRTNSYMVERSFERIKHGYSNPVNPIVLTFDSFESAHSFSIGYEISAANLPQAKSGSLNVVVQKDK